MVLAWLAGALLLHDKVHAHEEGQTDSEAWLAFGESGGLREMQLPPRSVQILHFEAVSSAGMFHLAA